MENSQKINFRINRNHQLNDIYVDDIEGPGNGRHNYIIVPNGYLSCIHCPKIGEINFQHGPRNAPNSISGLLDEDLLEIVRHRLQGFQKGAYASRENACALTHIEEALLFLEKRTNDRAERNVLGTDEV